MPQGITAKKESSSLVVTGKLGEAKMKFANPLVNFDVRDGEVEFTSNVDNRRSKRLIESYQSQLRGMFEGVAKGYTYKMKVCFTHFPVTVKVDKDQVIIENFLGERTPRASKIFPGVKVVVNKQDLTITGPDLYAVSQTAANIEQAARITRKDRRVFQDGIFITSKGE